MSVRASHLRRYAPAVSPVKPLPWRSGSYQSDTGSLGNNPAGHDRFAAWRGRPEDVVVYFITGTTWPSLINSPLYGLYSGTRYGNQASVITLGLFPYDDTSTLADAASGAYDSYYAQIGERLVAGGHPDCYLRLGWEMNGGYSWQGTVDAATAADYRTAYQRMVTQIRAAGWRGKSVFSVQPLQQLGTVGVDACYPGDDYADVIGPDWYDQGVQGSAMARFASRRDGLYGAQWWADFCRAGASRRDSSPGAGAATTATKALTYALPEWGLRNLTYPRPNGDITGNGGDSPYYVRATYDFLRSVAASGVTVEFEAYFNKDNGPNEAHQLFGGAHDFTRAARVYQQLFGGG